MEDPDFSTAWSGSRSLTARQAAVLYGILGSWEDEILDWLYRKDGPRGPLHGIAPFSLIATRALIPVSDNSAWSSLASWRCRAVADEIAAGALPFERPGCLFDELVTVIALREAHDLAPDMMDELPDLFANIPGQSGDDDWTDARREFSDRARHEEHDILLGLDHPGLRRVLDAHPPACWFDPPTPG